MRTNLFSVVPEHIISVHPSRPLRDRFAVIDCFGILDDGKIRRYLELGCEVEGLGRGHIKRPKEEIKTM